MDTHLQGKTMRLLLGTCVLLLLTVGEAVNEARVGSLSPSEQQRSSSSASASAAVPAASSSASHTEQQRSVSAPSSSSSSSSSSSRTEQQQAKAGSSSSSSSASASASRTEQQQRSASRPAEQQQRATPQQQQQQQQLGNPDLDMKRKTAALEQATAHAQLATQQLNAMLAKTQQVASQFQQYKAAAASSPSPMAAGAAVPAPVNKDFVPSPSVSAVANELMSEIMRSQPHSAAAAPARRPPAPKPKAAAAAPPVQLPTEQQEQEEQARDLAVTKQVVQHRQQRFAEQETKKRVAQEQKAKAELRNDLANGVLPSIPLLSGQADAAAGPAQAGSSTDPRTPTILPARQVRQLQEHGGNPVDEDANGPSAEWNQLAQLLHQATGMNLPSNAAQARAAARAGGAHVPQQQQQQQQQQMESGSSEQQESSSSSSESSSDESGGESSEQLLSGIDFKTIEALGMPDFDQFHRDLQTTMTECQKVANDIPIPPVEVRAPRDLNDAQQLVLQRMRRDEVIRERTEAQRQCLTRLLGHDIRSLNAAALLSSHLRLQYADIEQQRQHVEEEMRKKQEALSKLDKEDMQDLSRMTVQSMKDMQQVRQRKLKEAQDDAARRQEEFEKHKQLIQEIDEWKKKRAQIALQEIAEERQKQQFDKSHVADFSDPCVPNPCKADEACMSYPHKAGNINYICIQIPSVSAAGVPSFPINIPHLLPSQVSLVPQAVEDEPLLATQLHAGLAPSPLALTVAQASSLPFGSQMHMLGNGGAEIRMDGVPVPQMVMQPSVFGPQLMFAAQTQDPKIVDSLGPPGPDQVASQEAPESTVEASVSDESSSAMPPVNGASLTGSSSASMPMQSFSGSSSGSSMSAPGSFSSESSAAGSNGFSAVSSGSSGSSAASAQFPGASSSSAGSSASGSSGSGFAPTSGSSSGSGSSMSSLAQSNAPGSTAALLNSLSSMGSSSGSGSGSGASAELSSLLNSAESSAPSSSSGSSDALASLLSESGLGSESSAVSASDAGL